MKKKMNNKGFSLVELIIVIAIMAVLVGILAPQYLKYVNNSKVSTDVTNAQEIATVVNTLIADGKLAGTSVTLSPSDTVPASAPTSVAAANDKNFVLYNLGKQIAPKYSSSASYIVSYSVETGVSSITYKVDDTHTYEAYPNPDDAADGMTAKLKK